jgi:nitrogen permease regulator 2-like protein
MYMCTTYATSSLTLAMQTYIYINKVLEHHVPSLLLPCEQLLEIDWDLAIRHVLPYIDGVKCVKIVSMEADVDLSVCQEALSVLLWHECCCLLDIFQYSNVYALRPGAKRLFGSLCYR